MNGIFHTKAVALIELRYCIRKIWQNHNRGWKTIPL